MAYDPGVVTSAGSKVSIGTTAVDPTTDTYAEVGEITDAGSFGKVFTEIKFITLGNRAERKFKGSYNDGNMVVKVGRNAVDAGQAALITALDSDKDYNFKVELNDASDPITGTNTTFYFKAKVMGFPTTIGTPNQVVAGEFTLGIHSGTTTVVPAT